jgi:hypothetical protein
MPLPQSKPQHATRGNKRSKGAHEGAEMTARRVVTNSSAGRKMIPFDFAAEPQVYTQRKDAVRHLAISVSGTITKVQHKHRHGKVRVAVDSISGPVA